MVMNIPRGHAAGIHRDDLVVKAIERVWCFVMIWGLNSPLRSQGTSMGISPKSPSGSLRVKCLDKFDRTELKIFVYIQFTEKINNFLGFSLKFAS